jgi:hypothetical protein
LAKERRKVTTNSVSIEEAIDLFKQFQEIRTNGNGKPTYDPSVNVRDNADLERRHQAELRLADNKRLDDLRIKQEHCDKEIAQVREEAHKDHAEMESGKRDALALAEQRRLDGILKEQQNNVLIDSKDAGQRAETLRQQVELTAGTVTTTTNALRSTLEQADQEIRAQLAVVQQNQWSGGGRDAARTEDRGESQVSRSQIITIVGIGCSAILAMGSLVVGALGLGLVLYGAFHP